VPVPVIGHETGQWCAYPNFDVIGKFSGYMVPGNYEIWRDAAKENRILNKNCELAHASGRFQLACYKEDVEANLRTPSYSGYELLDLHDYLGQGGALIGVLDPFWESKGYVTPEEYRQFNSATVLLARLKERVLTTANTLWAQVEIAHYGPKPISNARPGWKIVADSGRVMADGQWKARSIPRGKNQFLGDISVDLSSLPASARYKLVVELQGEVEAHNEWNFWLYPKKLRFPAPSNVVVTHDWQEAEKELAHGSRVLFQPAPNRLSSDTPKMSTAPIFWNRLMNPEGAWMLGLLCAEKHPALAEFPTEAHCDWQWIDIAHNAPAIRLNQISPDIDPIVQPIDDWNRSWKLGLLFECRVGTGTLMVCCIDLDADPIDYELHERIAFQSNAKSRGKQTESCISSGRTKRSSARVSRPISLSRYRRSRPNPWYFKTLIERRSSDLASKQPFTMRGNLFYAKISSGCKNGRSGGDIAGYDGLLEPKMRRWNSIWVRRCEARQTRARMPIDDLQNWLNKMLARLSRKSDTALAIRCALVRWRALTRNLDDGMIEIDNSAVERVLRGVAPGRKNILFCGSDAGEQAADAIYSPIGSAKLNE
jgi:hypothetical protein